MSVRFKDIVTSIRTFSSKMAPKYLRTTAFECGVCSEEKPAGSQHVLAAGTDPICKQCFLSELKPRFQAAIDSEDRWPVTWGSVDLQPDDFPEFTAAFKMLWAQRERLYKTPKAERVYCRHVYWIKAGNRKQIVQEAEFVKRRREGKKTGHCDKFLGFAKESKGTVLKCKECQGSTCGTCGSAVFYDDFHKQHEHDCDPANLSKEPDIDASLIQGLDYQICPNEACRTRYASDGGCNAMTCKCRTCFCFICGQKAHHDSDHWSQGMACPRWGQPGTRKAQQDPVERPLEVPPHLLEAEAKLRAEADEVPDGPHSEHLRQLRTDQAVCYSILGNALAREKRAAEKRGDGNARIYWESKFVEPLSLLMNSMIDGLSDLQKNVCGTDDETETQSTMDPIEEAMYQADLIAQRQSDIEHSSSWLRKERPAVFDLYPELGPLLARYTSSTPQASSSMPGFTFRA